MNNLTGNKELNFPSDSEYLYVGGNINGITIQHCSRYRVIENATKKEYEFTGSDMIQWFKDILKTTLRTAVSARTFICRLDDTPSML